MAALSDGQAYALARQAGLSHEKAIIAVAIAHGESSLRTDAKGDVSLANRTWGPSLGLWQVRSINAQRGTGGSRDATRLTDPAFNAKAMASISSGGSNWRPWTAYTSGAYKRYVAQVRAAVGDGSKVPTGPVVGKAPTTADSEAGWDEYLVPPWTRRMLGFGADKLKDGAGDVAGDVAADVVKMWAAAMLPAGLAVVAVGTGFALIGVGLWRATQGSGS